MKPVLKSISVAFLLTWGFFISYHLGKSEGRYEATHEIYEILVEKGLVKQRAEVVLFNLGMNDVLNKSIHQAVKLGWPENKINQ